MSLQWIDKELRKSGRKKKDLALALNISSAKVSNMIHGRRSLQPFEVPRLAKFFGMSLERVYRLSGVGPSAVRGLHAPEPELFKEAPAMELVSADTAIKAFEMALDVTLEKGMSRQQAKEVAAKALELAQQHQWSVTPQLIEHLLEQE